MTETAKLMVWIDRDRCTSDGMCEAIAPASFVCRDDLTWAVKEDAEFFGKTIHFDGKEGDGHGPDGSSGMARVPDECVDAVTEAADQCFGEAITIVPCDAATMTQDSI